MNYWQFNKYGYLVADTENDIMLRELTKSNIRWKLTKSFSHISHPGHLLMIKCKDPSITDIFQSTDTQIRYIMHDEHYAHLCDFIQTLQKGGLYGDT